MKKTIFSLIAPILFYSAPSWSGPTPPKVHFHADFTGGYFDSFWCRGSMIPKQDPVFPSIRRDAFETDPDTDIVKIPRSWIEEAEKIRWPRLMSAAERRLPILLSTVEAIVGRPFRQRDFSFFFYFCPAFNGGTAIPAVYPIFPFLRSAVGDLVFPDWLFTDQYTFHEVLHLYVKEKIDYTRGSPVLNSLYGILLSDVNFEAKAKAYLGYPNPITPAYTNRWESTDRAMMIGLVLTHIHVYGIMTQVLRTLGQEEQLAVIRAGETLSPAAHPSYVWAWKFIESIETNPMSMTTLLNEVR